MNKDYQPADIEPKWNKVWDDTKLYQADNSSAKPKYYQLEFFPYPSGVTMHVGHVRNYVISDVYGRFKRMQGYNLLHPMGWDAFGLPAENQAIKTQTSPRASTDANIKVFKRQLGQVGLSYDWSREIDSSRPDYYQWTQWLFLLFYNRQLAYKAEASVNWCPHDKTVLANEQVIKSDGKNVCERCGHEVEKRQLNQWFFKITDYADRLLADLKDLDWPASIKAMQENWIGRSEGSTIQFKLDRTIGEIRSYIMGTPEIKDDLVQLGVKIHETTDSGHYKVSFPKEKVKAFEELLKEKLQPGFWNEYIDDEVIFIFKDKAGGIKRVRWDSSNESALLKLCNEYAGANFPSIREMLEGNDWYKGHLGNHIEVFTTRLDTIYGATFMVLAPEHPLVAKLTTPEQQKEVEAYIKKAASETEIERQNTDRTKTGVFTGVYAINPANGEKIPIWIADYVLLGYGTGAIMAVPAHDERDLEFAQKFKLPIKAVIEPVLVQTTGSASFRDDEPAVDSHGIIAIIKHWKEDKYLGLSWPEADWGTLLTGGIEDEHTPEQTVLKEILEETGYKHAKIIRSLGIIHSKYFHAPKKTNRFGHAPTFYVELQDGHQASITKEEQQKHTLHWLTLKELKDFLTATSHQQAIELLKTGVYTGNTTGN